MLNMASRLLPQACLEIVEGDQLRPVGEEHIIPLAVVGILEFWDDGLASGRKNAWRTADT
jgi:hypothetical protein